MRAPAALAAVPARQPLVHFDGDLLDQTAHLLPVHIHTVPKHGLKPLLADRLHHKALTVCLCNDAGYLALNSVNRI